MFPSQPRALACFPSQFSCAFAPLLPPLLVLLLLLLSCDLASSAGREQLLGQVGKFQEGLISSVTDGSLKATTPTPAGVEGTCNLRALMQNPEELKKSINWSNSNGTWRLSIANCPTQFSREEARQCILRGAPKGVLLIGDSITRYQYINLAYFLATGEWSVRPSNENEHEYNSWTDFFNITNQRMGGNELCDCYRNQTLRGSVTSEQWEKLRNEITENRFFSDRGVSVSYLQLFSPPVIRIHDHEKIRRCSPFCDGSNRTVVIDVDDVAALKALAADYSMTFLNAGHWFVYHSKNGFLTEQHAAILKEAGVHWKSTTSPSPSEQDFGRQVGAIYDANMLTSTLEEQWPKLRWDRLHFQTEVYRGLNEALLRYICSS